MSSSPSSIGFSIFATYILQFISKGLPTCSRDSFTILECTIYVKISKNPKFLPIHDIMMQVFVVESDLVVSLLQVNFPTPSKDVHNALHLVGGHCQFHTRWWSKGEVIIWFSATAWIIQQWAINHETTLEVKKVIERALSEFVQNTGVDFKWLSDPLEGLEWTLMFNHLIS